MLSVCPLGAVLPPKAADRSIEVITGAEPRTGASCGLSSTADEFWQIWNVRQVRDAETFAKIIPECDAFVHPAAALVERGAEGGELGFEPADARAQD
jgi:hypothetical protein